MFLGVGLLGLLRNSAGSHCACMVCLRACMHACMHASAQYAAPLVWDAELSVVHSLLPLLLQELRDGRGRVPTDGNALRRCHTTGTGQAGKHQKKTA